MTRLLLLAVLATAVAAAEPVKLATIDRSEITGLLETRVLAKPEHETIRTRLDEIEKAMLAAQQAFQKAMSAGEDEKRAAMEGMGQLHQQKRALMKQVESEIAGELIRVVREVSKGRYIAVIDAGADDALIVKDAELVDITLDVREAILVK